MLVISRERVVVFEAIREQLTMTQKNQMILFLII